MVSKKTQLQKKIIVGNWKMNPETLDTAKKLVSDIKRKTSKSKKSLIVLCPPAIFFGNAHGTPSKKVKFGLQDAHYDKSGSYTGEISASMARNMKAEFVIVGHSERRAMGESDEMIAKKVKAVIHYGMTPILCIGEKEVDEHAHYLGYIKNQLQKGLALVGSDSIQNIIIAYEPVYAIGGSVAIGTHEIYQRNIFIKKVLSEMYGKQKAFTVPILYGGSTNPDNAKEIVRDGSVDGLLVGHESLKADHFADIINKVESI